MAFTYPSVSLLRSLASLLIGLSLILTLFSLTAEADDYGLTARLTRRLISSSSSPPPSSLPLSSIGAVSAPIINMGAYYLMTIRIGTNKFPVEVVVDTSNELTWFQCHPCLRCYEQSTPIFNPRSSTGYRRVNFGSPDCSAVGERPLSSNPKPSNCPYAWESPDGASSKGVLSLDNVTVGSVSIADALFGCGHDNGIAYGNEVVPESGNIGFGRSNYSFVSQMGEAAGNKFSYCLVAVDARRDHGYIHFGAAAGVAGRGAVVAQLVGGNARSFHYLHLDYVTVNAAKMSQFPSGTNIIVNTGTAVTLLPSVLYEGLVGEVKRAMKGAQLLGPRSSLDPLCYAANNATIMKRATLGVTMGFRRNARVRLNGENVLVPTDREGVKGYCLAFGNAGPGEAILGSLSQVNFLVGFDLSENTVTFKRADCAA